MRLKYKIGLIVVAMAISVCLLTFQSYALWQEDWVSENENDINTGCFDVKFEESSGGSNVKLHNTYPVDDSKGLQSTPYTFTIKNTCNVPSYYKVTLNTLQADQVTESDSSNSFKWTEKIKFSLKKTSGTVTAETGAEGAAYNLSDYISGNTKRVNTDKSNLTTKNGETIAQSIILATGTLNGGENKEGESVTYELRIWLDGTKAGNEVMGKQFNAKIEVINMAKYEGMETEDVTTNATSSIFQSAPIVTEGAGLYEVKHQDNDLALGWNMTELRYAGPSEEVSNYVYFNCEDEENQTAETCEKWRVLGLVNVETENGIEQRLKVVPTTLVTSSPEVTEGPSIDGEEPPVSEPTQIYHEDYNSYVDTVIWQDLESPSTQDKTILYKEEKTSDKTEESKTGTLSLSDYQYASSLDGNWLPDTSNYPALYLDYNVKIVSGTGTSSDPFQLQKS